MTTTTDTKGTTMNVASARQLRAIYKSTRLLPCGCRVKGGPSAKIRVPYIMCDEANRLDAELDAIMRPAYYGKPYDKTAQLAKLDEIQAHYAQTPVYKGGGRDVDFESSASRQHYIDTGRYLLRGEANR